jgi:pimeloyl-ACP methyl ester carboxylesterase
MMNLNGTDEPVVLAPGYTITAPGLLGTATIHQGRLPGTRDGGPEKATEAFDNALKAAGLDDIMTIEMDVQSVPSVSTGGPPTSTRTAQGEEGLVLEVPAPYETEEQIVLAIDEDGVVSWNFPVDKDNRMQSPEARRGVGETNRFCIRSIVPPVTPSRGPVNRSLFGMVGKKILKVLVFKVTDPIIGPLAEMAVRKWEEKKRPYLVRSFSPDDYLQPTTAGFQLQDWQKMTAGRALLFVHGTTSQCWTGFANFKRDELQSLHQAYEGRVFAFNHFTLSDDPVKNAAKFKELIPGDLSLNIDIICHSRGGLVARTLAGEINPISGISVRRIVFVGVPNHGTALADPDNLVSFIDRYTGILNLAPPGPLAVVSDILEGIIMVVKIISHAVLNGVPGLTAMNPKSRFLEQLNRQNVQKTTQYYAITADYTPKGGLKEMVMDGMVDRIFKDAPNDLLVPTLGVFEGRSPGFPIPVERVLQFPASTGVAHSDYFSQAETYKKIKEWLLN